PEPGQHHGVLRFPEHDRSGAGRAHLRVPEPGRLGDQREDLRLRRHPLPGPEEFQRAMDDTERGLELAPSGPYPLRGIPDLVDRRSGARDLSARPERPQGRGEDRVARNARGLLPLPRLPRKISDPLPQRRARGPRHDGALGDRRYWRRHQPAALALTAKGDNMIKMSRRTWLGMAGAAAALGVVGLPPLQRESRA